MKTKNALVIERTFDAPVARVWKAWTDPAELTTWWGPTAFTAPVIRMDLRVGGTYLFCMHGRPSPDAPAQDFWSTGTYKEVVPLRRIVCTDSFADAEGNIVSPAAYGMPADMPEVLEVTLSFEGLPNGTTRMTLHHDGMPEGQMQELAGMGWNESFDKLARVLANE